MSHAPCLFCRIVEGSLDAEIVGESRHSIAFRDIAPVAPTHVLVIPREHAKDLGELAEDPMAIADLVQLARQVADEAGLDRGYRMVANTGSEGGQVVFHAHLHVIGGRGMEWPPG
ncbi:MAG TPA: HIT domain-containing protein [Dermatophilaceae bacterium]|nr:HIT domain-containing protein [Dermatophilaceae bacterium]